jgi:phosphatidylserine/phosphatidylglycerophosphate/cardiolipin synthase-like enzyme
MKKPRTLVFIFLAFALLMGLSAIVLAVGGDPQTLFTDNITATGTSLAVTGMEQQLLNRLNAASTSIDAAIYSLDRASIRDALIAAQGREVAVRVVADDDAYNQAGYKPYFQALEAAGIPVILDNRSSLMRNKFFVIDGLLVWSGSTNMTNTGFTYNHNNSLVFTSTQLADIYTTEFDEMFVSGLFGTAKTDNTTHTLTYAGSLLESYFSPSDGAMGQLISEVNAADESIYFAIYSFTDDSLRDAIIARKQAGVTVQGIFDQFLAGSQSSDDEALCAAGIPVKIEDFGGALHDKFMVIDPGGTDPVVVTGSMNWSASGANTNDENTLIIHDAETAAAYLGAFQALYNALGDETLCTGGAANQVFLPMVMRNATGPPVITPPTPIIVSLDGALVHAGSDLRVLLDYHEPMQFYEVYLYSASLGYWDICPVLVTNAFGSVFMATCHVPIDTVPGSYQLVSILAVRDPTPANHFGEGDVVEVLP